MLDIFLLYNSRIMNDEQKQSLKEAIQNELATSEEKLLTLQKELKPLKKSCAYDDVEYASLYDDYNIRYKEAENLQKRIKSLQKSLIKIDNEEYGICEECGEEIPLARLELVPESSHCVQCLSQED